MSRLLLLILLFSTYIAFPQSFGSISRICLDHLGLNSELDVLNSDEGGFILLLNQDRILKVEGDSVYQIASIENKLSEKALFSGNHIYSFEKKKLVKFRISNGKLIRVKSRSIKIGHKKRHLVLYGVFKEKKDLFYVFQYNNFKTSDGHDVIYIYKTTDKLRLIKHEEINIGPEILLSPFNFQNIGFESGIISIALPFTHQIININTDLEIVDTCIIDTGYYQKNKHLLDSFFNRGSPTSYLYRPSDFMDQWLKSFDSVCTLNKWISLHNSSTYLVSSFLKYRNLYTLKVIDTKTKRKLSVDTFEFGSERNGHLAYSTRVYFNKNKIGAIPRIKYLSDSTFTWDIDFVKYWAGKSFEKSWFDTFNILNEFGHKINMNEFSNFIFADFLYCYGCNPGNEITLPTRETIMILASEKSEPQAKMRYRASKMKEIHPQLTHIFFLDSKQFNWLTTKHFELNTYYPLVE
jgi:hypothetical protein